MKKSILILAILILPTLAFTADCYTDWLDGYSQAENQYADDIDYCYGRSVDLYILTCFLWANYDYGDRLNEQEDQYQGCLNNRQVTPSGGSRNR